MSISQPQTETYGRSPAAAFLSPSAGKKAWLARLAAFLFLAFRLSFDGFLLLTSIYCLLLSVPFSYFGFIHHPLLAWLPAFVQLHGLIYGALICVLALTLIPEVRAKSTRTAVLGFLAFNLGAALYIWRTNPLAGLQLDLRSYVWSMMSLLPLAWLAAIDLSDRKVWLVSGNQGPIDLARSTLAAVIASVIFAASSMLHSIVEHNIPVAGVALRGFAASLCFHLIIFTAVGLILTFIRFAADKTPYPRLLNFVLSRVLAAWLLTELLRSLVLPTISFEGAQANVFAATVSSVLVLSVTGIAAKCRTAIHIGLRIASLSKLSIVWWICAASALFAIAYSIPALLGRNDWDFVLQRMAVVAAWVAILQTVCFTGIRLRGRVARITTILVIAIAAAGFVAYAKLALYNPEPSALSREVFEAYAGTDISFKTAYDILSRPVDNQASRQFYDFLKQHTNLGRDVNVGPADVRLVSDLQPSPGIKPNIFVFVIDSLRHDFLSPYNPAVDYTPEIGRFAGDSIVFDNAFTRYGGTALSEPAIWTGTMQLHKQYIEPFYPMNNLQKLLEVDGYHDYVSVDPILNTILQPSASITELDKNTKSWGDLDFIPTLEELEAKIDTRSDLKEPIFAYTQPQNVHTLTLQRSRIKGGRKAASISELRKMDAAFGEFVTFLRQRGLYDNSIIILTADHGDCYGEFGRYGHSDFLFPQVIRIPLIVHLPPRLRKALVWNPHRVAFTTDLTPSLYYLLGHRPILNNEMYGQPIFTDTRLEQLQYVRSNYLLASSYAPVYAILGGGGQSLFIVDAVNAKNYFYNLADDPVGAHSHVTVQLRNENEALIRHHLQLIDNLYGWNPVPGTR